MQVVIQMRVKAVTGDDAGFGLVELMIAIFLLAIISIALIPALYNSIRYSADQSTTATATRQLNALVEQARQAGTCSALVAAKTPSATPYKNGAGATFTTSGTLVPGPNSSGICPAATVEHLTITATDSNGKTLATVDALVYLP
ncbi:hypothetical protein LK09_03960 [Microbacterium mangrovi]|uniref:Prepilin-type N-terminal cleavage/methylation domain-containing protein n=1 Tax=Microbacterium mangrovi TaxID=1348253 RepID=A0A0B2A7T9_9MICO|nr:type II secretion system protein [Microbacterium mangrovi]KHK99170.1 hypothetical protein LK09_03960 [Microbacterium mangrovi]